MFGNSKTLFDAITKVIDTKYYKYMLAHKYQLLAEGACFIAGAVGLCKVSRTLYIALTYLVRVNRSLKLL